MKNYTTFVRKSSSYDHVISLPVRITEIHNDVP